MTTCEGQPALSRADRELYEWIDLELEFYVKGMINEDDLRIFRRNLFNIARAERRRRGSSVSRRRVSR